MIRSPRTVSVPVCGMPLVSPPQLPLCPLCPPFCAPVPLPLTDPGSGGQHQQGSVELGPPRKTSRHLLSPASRPTSPILDPSAANHRLNNPIHSLSTTCVGLAQRLPPFIHTRTRTIPSRRPVAQLVCQPTSRFVLDASARDESPQSYSSPNTTLSYSKFRARRSHLVIRAHYLSPTPATPYGARAPAAFKHATHLVEFQKNLQRPTTPQSRQNVGRGVAIPLCRHHKCGQPLPPSLLHHHVQRSGMVRSPPPPPLPLMTRRRIGIDIAAGDSQDGAGAVTRSLCLCSPSRLLPAGRPQTPRPRS